MVPPYICRGVPCTYSTGIVPTSGRLGGGGHVAVGVERVGKRSYMRKLRNVYCEQGCEGNLIRRIRV